MEKTFKEYFNDSLNEYTEPKVWYDSKNKKNWEDDKKKIKNIEDDQYGFDKKRDQYWILDRLVK